MKRQSFVALAVAVALAVTVGSQNSRAQRGGGPGGPGPGAPGGRGAVDPNLPKDPTAVALPTFREVTGPGEKIGRAHV